MILSYKEFRSIYSNIPKKIYRSFDDIKHLETFLSGKIRLGHYKYYFNFPDYSDSPKHKAISNKYEGNTRNLSYVDENGSLKTWNVLSQGTAHYSLSFSREPLVEYGQYIVELNDPHEFHQRIQKFLNTDCDQYMGNMVYCDGVDTKSPLYGSRLLCIHYESSRNAGKKEFRFSYNINYENGLLRLPNNKDVIPNGHIRYEDDPKVGKNTMPHICWLEGVKVADLFRVL